MLYLGSVGDWQASLSFLVKAKSNCFCAIDFNLSLFITCSVLTPIYPFSCLFSYQIMVLELLSPLKAQTLQSRTSEFVELHVPSGLNLMEDAEYASQAALWGIEVCLAFSFLFLNLSPDCALKWY